VGDPELVLLVVTESPHVIAEGLEKRRRALIKLRLVVVERALEDL